MANGYPVIIEWEDLRFPATSAKALSGKEPGVEADTGLYLFSATATESVAMLAQMPHAWYEGTEVRPHIHWQKTTSAAGDVAWQLEYKISPINEIMDASWTSEIVTEAASGHDTDTANQHIITPFTAIDMTGETVSCCIIFKVSRIGGNAADTYGADARLLEFDIHLQMDSRGSLTEYAK